MAKVNYIHLLSTICFYAVFGTIDAMPKNQSGFSLKMLHWNSPELPSHKPNQSREELMDELIHLSNERIKSLEHHLTVTAYADYFRPIRPTLEAITARSVYLVQVGIGTFQNQPTFQQNYLMLETLGQHTWTQCEGCSPCFAQRQPYFPWSRSSTFQIAPCQNCPGICQSDQCIIQLRYGPDILVSGRAVRDTFTFQSQTGHVQIPDTDFVCAVSSHNYNSAVIPTSNRIESGVFSLSRAGYTSLMKNVENPNIHDGRFSYCLPPLGDPVQNPTYLRFGRDIVTSRTPSTGRKYTTPILNSPIGVYYVEVTGLGVGKKRVGVDPYIFQMKSDGSGGCVIDPGIPFSHIPSVAYNRLEESLAEMYEEKNSELVARLHPSPVSGFSLCYEQISTIVPVSPTIKFYLANNSYLIVEKPMKEYTFGGRRLHCLPIKSGGLCVIGAIQQADHRFIYDTRRSLLSFRKENCAIDS
ncbi:hypothetical protein vseg_006935 [Gypsophila vaccaria]